ncbi:MAG: hypothetical protein FWD78_03075 [Treponema sp.]|nr:hypothetical protein [Treponema sp.]
MKNKSALIKNGFALLIAGVLVFTFLGCSSGGNKTSPFQIAFCSLYVNESAVSDYGAALLNSIPDLSIDGKAPLFTPMIMGESQNDNQLSNDPMANMASIMKAAAVVSTGDLDVMIADMDNGARNARSGMFMNVSDLFPGEDLSALGTRLLSFDILNTDSYQPVPTGEKTPVCGISITGNDQMKKIFGDQEIGVFVVANTKNLELAQKVVRSLL